MTCVSPQNRVKEEKSWTIENKFDEAGSTSWLIWILMTFVIDPE